MVYVGTGFFYFTPEQWVESREGETSTLFKKLMPARNLAGSNTSAMFWYGCRTVMKMFFLKTGLPHGSCPVGFSRPIYVKSGKGGVLFSNKSSGV